MEKTKVIELDIAGLGLIIYSPFAVESINDGDDYLSSNFWDPATVEREALLGRLVGVALGSSGKFFLTILSGYPENERVERAEYKLRLGVEVRDNVLCVRDLYDLMDWCSQCPVEQQLSIESGFYHITMLSNTPVSGILGDNQNIEVYLTLLSEMPKLRYGGVPTLCY